MNRLLASLGLVCLLLGAAPFRTLAAPATPATTPGKTATAAGSAVDGRLGGSQASFEKRFGKNTGRDERVDGLGFDVKGYDLVVVTFANKQGIRVTLSPVRASHVQQNDADPGDWSKSQYEHVLGRFLPTDVQIIGQPIDTGDGRKEGACKSKALAIAFSKTTWKKLHAGGNPGECHYLLSPDTDGKIYSIEIGIGRSGSLNRPTPTATATPRPTSTPRPEQTATSTSGFSDDELAYMDAIKPIISNTADALDALSGEMSASDSFTTNWKYRVATQLAILQASYQQLQAITPPPLFEGSYGLLLQGMAQYSASADDLAYGIDHYDTDSINRAGDEIRAGNNYVNQASDALTEELASRSS